MPKKNKKSKFSNETKSNCDTVENDCGEIKNSVEEIPTVDCDDNTTEESKSFCLPLDRKLKMQLKRQKKKEKKKAFDEARSKSTSISEVIGKKEEENSTKAEEVAVTETFKKIHVEIFDDYLKGLDEKKKVETEEKLADRVMTMVISHLENESGNVPMKANVEYLVETIPEDLFEEFIENEEIVQVRETVRAFPRTSPLHSPNFGRKHHPEKRVVAVVESSSPPKVLYNYQGVTLNGQQPIVAVQEDSSEFQNDEDTCHNRKLDVIQEESSDFSDTSGHSDKNRKAPRGNKAVDTVKWKTFAISAKAGDGPLMTKMYPVYEEIKEEGSEIGVEETVQHAAPGTVSKIPGSTGNESDGKIKLNQNEESNRISNSLQGFGRDLETGKTEEDESNQIMDINDLQEKSTWSMKSISSTSTKLLEESESWRSSIEPDTCTGFEADVESELESQKLIFDTSDADLNLKMSDLRSSDAEDEVHIFLRNYKKCESSDRGSEYYLEPSLNSLTCLSTTGEYSQNETPSKIDLLPVDVGKLGKVIEAPILEERDADVVPSGGENFARDGLVTTKKAVDEKTLAPVSVKNRAEAIKNNMDKILISKLKVIQSLDECQLSESTWASVLENTKNQLEKRNQVANSRVNDSNRKLVSNYSSYENISKIEKKIHTPARPKTCPQNPEALSNLAEKKILSLPYGKLVLKRIGLGKCCSNDSCSGGNKDLEEDVYEKSGVHPNEQSFGLSSELSDVSIRSVPVGIWNKVRARESSEPSESRSYIEFDYGDSRIGQSEKWYGTRTAMPTVLLGLSPSQRKAYEGTRNKFMDEEDEAASLIDLHRKFIERRSHDEPSLYNSYRHMRNNDATVEDSISVLKLGEPRIDELPERWTMPSVTNANARVLEAANGRQIASETSRLTTNEFGTRPNFPNPRLVGKIKSKSKDYSLRESSNGHHHGGDRMKEEHESTLGEKTKAGKKQRKWAVEEPDAEVVGKNRLLAIVQNAISDNFVPESNGDTSIKSTSESHKDPYIQTQGTMLNSWQNNPIFRYAPSYTCEEENGETSANLFTENQSFGKIWNREKNMARTRVEEKNRPKTVCYETETEVVEPLIVKESATVRRTPAKKSKLDENEQLVITENLPAVSDVIKSFKEPAPKSAAKDQVERYDSRRQIQIDTERYSISKRGDIAFLQNGNGDEERRLRLEKRKSMPASLLSEKEEFNQKMYNEYMSKLAERFERRQKKVIRVSQSNEIEISDGEFKCPQDLEYEFIQKAKERREKLSGIWDGEDRQTNEGNSSEKKPAQDFADLGKSASGGLENLENGKGGGLVPGADKDGGGTESSNSKRSSVQFILDTNSDVESLPKHLREFLQVEETEEVPEFLNGVWSPSQKVSVEKTEVREENKERKKLEDEPIPPVWTPKSAQPSPILEKKEFRPVNFESPVLTRKKYVQEEKRESSVPPPWRQPGGDRFPELAKSPSSPVLSLPKAPNPTVTLLQKAREGHLPRGAHYLNAKMNDSSKTEACVIDGLEIVSTSKTESDQPQRKVEAAPKKVIGIGPTTKEGIPLVLRSEVNEENKEKWYKRMYDSLHKAGNDDDFVTVKYRTSPSRKGLYGSQGYQYGSGSGYQSEPEALKYDLTSNKYITLDRRRTESEKETEPELIKQSRSHVSVSPPRQYFPGYKNQPGRIEDYEPGRCSISDLETNKWWDEVLEIFDREEERSRPIRKEPSPRSFTNYASGYVSDPQFVYKRNEDEVQSPVSSEEQKEAYRIIQKGGEIPLKGLRKPAPERPKDKLDAEIEYFPLSSTLTRIRVHKQNITPLSEFPFYSSPCLYQRTTLNFPVLPFGVCSSFSQVQIFPPCPPLTHYSNPELCSGSPGSITRGQKFSVQLQNISDASGYVRIVPKPRLPRSKSPIYANLPLGKRSGSPALSDIKEESNNCKSSETSEATIKNSPKIVTFSDLKRVAPSVLAAADSLIRKIVRKDESEKNRAEVLFSLPIAEKNSNINCSTLEKAKLEKQSKKDKNEISIKRSADTSEKKLRKSSKTSRHPLSESLHREKPLLKTGKRSSKSFAESSGKKPESKKLGEIVQIARIKRKNSRGDPESFKIVKTAKNSHERKSIVKCEEESEDTGMSRIHVEKRPNVDADMTEVFRSRSFSPEVRRKIFKFPDMNKPLPSESKKPPKTSPTQKMWAKMKESYPGSKSLSEFGPNIKYLQDKIRRKFKDVKDVKQPEFEDEIETVRTVKKDENGDMTIKTNRYIRFIRSPTTGSPTVRSTYPIVERRKIVSETKKRYGSTETLKPRETSKPLISVVRKISSKKPEMGSAGSSARSETLEKKAVSASTKTLVSSRNKDHAKKIMGVSSLKKSSTVVRSSPSPCPSGSSYRSGGSDKRSTPSPERAASREVKAYSPISSQSRLSSPSALISSGSKIKVHKFNSESKVALKPATGTRIPVKTAIREMTSKIPTLKKSSENKIVKTVFKKKESGKRESESKRLEMEEVVTVTPYKKPREIVFKAVHEGEEEENEIKRGRDLVRTDSFFQNLFLRGPMDRKPTLEIEKISSVLERARIYQKRINLPSTYKSEPSLSLVTYYLHQKRPVSYSRFRLIDRDFNSPRSYSPLGSLHSENFQMRLRRFDSMSLLGDGLSRDMSPEEKERSSSEPPLRRSAIASPEESKRSRFSQSEISSIRSSPVSSRSPSGRRIKSYRAISKSLESHWASKPDSEEKFKYLHRNISRSISSLNLSNYSDRTEYRNHLLELMHSTRKCERFRELHKFYSNLEKMDRLEKTASTGDLRPRLRNEEIIDFDRWKKVRTKERAEAELKVLIDNLMKDQKEKDLLFRASDIDAVRWKGDRGLRIKERSVEDLKEHFDRCAMEEADPNRWRKDWTVRSDYYKSLWKGSSISDVANNLNALLASRKGRPVTLEEFERIEATDMRSGKEYGHTLKTWSSLSKEQVNVLKDQLNEIYTADARKRRIPHAADGFLEKYEKYEIEVPVELGVKSPGESSLHVRCTSELSKSQTYTPTAKRKENIQREWKKAESISSLPFLNADDKKETYFSSSHVSVKDDNANFSKITRSHSETRYSKGKPSTMMRSSSSRVLTENEKKLLSRTLSKEVAEKMGTKGSQKAPVLPRETLGALAAAATNLKDERCTSPVILDSREEEKYEEFREEIKSGRESVSKLQKGIFSSEMESGSNSSETSTKTVITKNSADVLKKVQYFEDLQSKSDDILDYEYEKEIYKEETKRDERYVDGATSKKREKTLEVAQSKQEKGKKKMALVSSSSVENMNDYFGHQKQYASSVNFFSKREELLDEKNIFEGSKWVPVRYDSTSPVCFKRVSCRGSDDSLFSYRSRSVSPDPTKYYRAYLKMVKCGAVRKLCNKFESWEDLLSLSSDKDFWLPPAPRRFASDPELTRDLLRRYGTDSTKVTIRGQEVGDVKWLKTKFENPGRGRNRFRRVRSPLVRSPITDRYMPRINVISKRAELQLQGKISDPRQRSRAATLSPPRIHEFRASPEGYSSLIDYTKDCGGYYFTGEVEKLRRKFERLQDAEKLSILGQMYTSTPDVNELRDIAPYLQCSWVAHRYPGGSKSPEPPIKKREPPKKVTPKPRPRSSSPVRTKAPSSILKPSHPPASRFAGQKFDPAIHRPKYRYQPEPETDEKCKRGDPDAWRHWNKPSVKFKETVSFKIDPEIRDLSPGPESPRKYVESEVTIHYKSPVRSEAKAMLSDDELARRQAESMKRIYKEERRRKYLQELQDMNSRRHTDNFIPSQKSPIPLNRYDDFPFFPEHNTHHSRGREYTVDPVLVARGLYDFVGRRPRELAFRRGDIIFIVRKLDKNWCEGELNGVVGLFPLSYVEVIPYNEINMRFGRAMAKYDFVPQTPVELSARKGDMITLLRKIDENWFEGRIGDRTGIIPASYCHILALPQSSGRTTTLRQEKISKPVAAPAAHSLIHNGSGLSSKHYYTPYLSSPNSPGRSTVSSASANYHDGSYSADMLIDEALMQLDEELEKRPSSKASLSQPLNVRINPRPEPAMYQVLFNHVPSNDDELELIQGETVTVVEKCGDGWYIGSKTSDGKLGIFPGTHVRKIASEFV